tara:strand:- start:72 stop:455 length:384 start_codon:yes stop_codon:yes gene_type:complete
MSTLKVNTIQDASGGNSSTATQIAQGRAKAWINFNGTGTIAIRDSFNVSSITDNGTGDTTVTLSTAQATANYVVCANSGHTSSDPLRNVGLFVSFTTTTFRILTMYPDGAPSFGRDDQLVCVAVFGD